MSSSIIALFFSYEKLLFTSTQSKTHLPPLPPLYSIEADSDQCNYYVYTIKMFF